MNLIFNSANLNETLEVSNDQLEQLQDLDLVDSTYEFEPEDKEEILSKLNKHL